MLLYINFMNGNMNTYTVYGDMGAMHLIIRFCIRGNWLMRLKFNLMAPSLNSKHVSLKHSSHGQYIPTDKN